MRAWLVATLVLALLWLVPTVPAFAQAAAILADQAEANTAADSVEALVERAREDGYRILLVPPEAISQSSVTSGDDLISVTSRLESRASAAHDRLVQIFEDLHTFPDHVAEIVELRADGGTVWWPLLAVLLAAGFLAIGFVVARLVEHWMVAKFASLYSDETQTRSEKIGYLLIRVLLRSVVVVIQVGVAGVLTIGFGPDAPAWRSTMILGLLCFGVARLMVVLMQGLLAPDAASRRLPYLSDRDAHGLYRGFAIATWIAVPLGGICLLMDMMSIDRDAHLLMLLTTMFLAAGLFAYLAVRYNEAVGGAILGPNPERRGPALRLFARMWHGFAVVYLMGAWATSAIRLLIAAPNPLGLILAPVLGGILVLSIYAVALLIIDWVFAKRGAVMALAEPGAATGPVRRKGLKELAEHAVALVLLAGYVLFVFGSWFSVSNEGERFLDAMSEIMLVGFLAYLAFEAVKVAIDDRIAAETGPDTEEVETGSEGGGVGATRLATLLPIFRNFLLAVIASIAGMVMLSEVGIDIAPLFAGAGVVGLAVGFGAQTLIRDIFSGAFFLLDDAFRRGEYIEIAGTRGTVEKISIRSMQLRHHLGPLHTIPFGEIPSLTNFSRDWVMMKLPLRLPYDTDPEKVRKLVKQLGKELMEHPEIGGKFLEPLKSQGVYQMEDSAMIFRVKFMTKPGDQFPVRKVVYARIRELFEQNGIKFAHKEVTVRIAEGPDRPLTTGEQEAVTGAVGPLIDAEAEAGAVAPSDTR